MIRFITEQSSKKKIKSIQRDLKSDCGKLNMLLSCKSLLGSILVTGKHMNEIGFGSYWIIALDLLALQSSKKVIDLKFAEKYPKVLHITGLTSLLKTLRSSKP